LKYKYLTIAFSIVIVLILFIAVLLPLMIWSGTGLQSNAGLMLRSSPFSYTPNLLLITLLFFVIIVIILVSFTVFFFLNYRLFSLLEREDWPALAYYLEQELFVKGKYSIRKVQLLASSYMVISDYSSVLKLESKAMLVKPITVAKNAMIFGAARVLNGNYKEAAAFFRKYIEKNDWLRWYYGFSCLLGGVFSQAESEFTSLVTTSRNPLITGLSAYFLANNLIRHSLKSEECRTAAENGCTRVVEKLKKSANWYKKVKKSASEIHIAVIRKYVDETGKWLFSQEVSL